MNSEETKETNSEINSISEEIPQDNQILTSRFASGIATRGGGNKVASALEKASRIMGLPTDADTTTSPATSLPKAVEKPAPEKAANRIVLGRGAWAALLILAVLIPLLVWAVFTIIDLDRKVIGYRSNLGSLTNNQLRDPILVTMISSPNLKTYPMITNEPQSQSAIYLHVTEPEVWGISFSGANALVPKEMFLVLWAERATPKAGLPDRVFVASLGGANANAGVFIVNRDNIPDIKQFSRLVVTGEPIDQPLDKSSGVPLFTLDLSSLKSKS